MKVYVIPAWYPQDENDTTAIFFRQQTHALAARMAELYIDRGRYDPERIRHDCVERFSADAVCGRIEEVYSLIIGDRKQDQPG